MFHHIARIVKIVLATLLNWQGQFLQKRLFKRLGYDGKKSYKGCTLELNSEQLDKEKKLTEEVAGILVSCKNDAGLVVEFLKNQGVAVYRVKSLEKKLEYINEAEGFLTERTGFHGLVLNYIVGNGFGFRSSVMVLLEDGEYDIYKLINALHKWCAYKNGFTGLDEYSQRILRRFDTEQEKNIIGRLSLKDIERVRAAIARNVQAIDFVVQYSKEHAGAKNALNKIKDEGGVDI